MNEAAVASHVLRVQVAHAPRNLIHLFIGGDQSQAAPASAADSSDSEEIALVRRIESQLAVVVGQVLAEGTIERLAFSLVDDGEVLVVQGRKAAREALVDGPVFGVGFRMVHHVEHLLGIALAQGAVALS